MSTKNITLILKAVLTGTTAWPRESFLGLLAALAAKHEDAVIDWDEGVPENWGRVLVDNNVVAIVFRLRPFAVVSSSEGEGCDAPEGVTVLVVDDMSAEKLSADRATTESLLERPLPHHWNAQKFSVDDLWWATVA